MPSSLARVVTSGKLQRGPLRKGQRWKATTAADSPRTRLERRQIPIFSASRTSSSRKSGCAIEMRASARSHVDLPFRFTIPYSVTTQETSALGSVTMAPSVSRGLIRETTLPFFSKVELRHRKALPPFER